MNGDDSGAEPDGESDPPDEDLADEFDAVVELRPAPEVAPHDAEERWHRSGTDVATPWVPLQM